MQKLVAGLALALALFAAPGASWAQTSPAVMAGSDGVHATLASFPSTIHEVESLSLQQAVAILGGAALGTMLVDNFIERSLVSLAGTVVGAIAGNTWYEKHYWPFQ